MLPVEPAAPPGPDQGPEHPGLSRLLSALFYGSCSFLITVINKTVLTSFRFPSYLCLGIGQMVTTVIVLYVAKMSKTVQFQDFDRGVLLKIFPLPLLYVGNHITGLASTKKLSLPMFTVLRKFTIVMTMVLEIHILRKTFPKRAVCSVAAIVFGAVVAASSDLAFDMEAYTFILFNDAFTAAYGVYTKKKLGDQSLGKYGVLFYNAIIIVIPTLMLSAYTGDLHKVCSDVFHSPLQLLQLSTHHHRGWSVKECCCGLCRHLYWWRLSVLVDQLPGPQHLYVWRSRVLIPNLHKQQKYHNST
ncbi:UDP-N-acetylglucosamine/UDP-glucose/GDP-mannose transporter isoform X2 [Gouania willdenowi]|uniref:UDP-N-acetylglucosamine/UDP-glucose/GDP-mannose transporter isoform X2 n=1 Tax=Gouania willdenowi TaxID=441366 RepID=UPI0010547A91|nr:UDP-N-acetylglucosamine/UDP-glucose/GDP-mannose transporter isoform X2 [Gouania willdenowi]